MTDQTAPTHPDQAKWDAARDAADARFLSPVEPTDEQREAVSAIAESVTLLATYIHALVPAGPQRAIALTELESVQMRANRGIFQPTIPQEQRR